MGQAVHVVAHFVDVDEPVFTADITAIENPDKSGHENNDKIDGDCGSKLAKRALLDESSIAFESGTLCSRN